MTITPWNSGLSRMAIGSSGKIQGRSGAINQPQLGARLPLPCPLRLWQQQQLFFSWCMPVKPHLGGSCTFYLLPLVLITILYGDRIAVVCAGVALLCADYFLQDPVFSFYTSEYNDLIWFAALAAVGIATTRKLFRRSSGGNAASSR